MWRAKEYEYEAPDGSTCLYEVQYHYRAGEIFAEWVERVSETGARTLVLLADVPDSIRRKIHAVEYGDLFY